MTDWIFQRNAKQYHLDAAIAASRLQSWRTPRYRDRTAAGDRVRLQVVGRHDPGIYYVAATAALASFRPFRGFQGSTVPLPADIAAALRERAAPRLDVLGPDSAAP